MSPSSAATRIPSGIEAVVFDTDGVVTDTARVHMAAWKQLFDAYLIDRFGEDHLDEFTEADYLTYVDGRPRYDGVQAFLASRGIELERGDPSDPPGAMTICGLGNAKDANFVARLKSEGAQAFTTTVTFIEALHVAGIRTAVVSASRNCAQVLASAGVDGLFEVRVDGLDSDRLGLAGKPDPAIFIEAARQLGTDVGHVAVVEDAIAGVEAARSGGFGLVIGVDRVGQRDELARFADIVVDDLGEMSVSDGVV